ncbi:MAG: hypothetical protein EXR98_20405 [Gemmataceae bacterium]|nr:hypothetical protein [Gemmataceae bacterium]
MKTFILTIAVAALTLTIASPMQAGPKTGGFNKSSASNTKSVSSTKVAATKTGGFNKSSASNTKSVSSTKVAATKTSPASKPKVNPGTAAKVKDYHVKFGSKFQGGYVYKGKHHNHWGLIRFDLRYGCDCYWDPCVLVWYYWCERDICYYPVSYCPYRSYVCPEVVVQSASEVALPVANDGSTTIRPDAAPPVNDIAPIPEPVSPRKE